MRALTRRIAMPTGRGPRSRTATPTGSGPRNPTNFHHLGSIKMYSMHEALARDRMREREWRSRQGRLARELAAERRWHRLSLHARAAQARHAHRVSRAPVR
jgi:hypothetical protein